MCSIRAFSILLGITLLTVSVFGQQSKRDVGIELYRVGNFAEAVLRLTEATDEDKMDRHALWYLAAAYQHLGRDKEAIKAFERTRSIERSKEKINPPEYDKPAKITSRPMSGIKSNDAGPPSNYTVLVELCSDGTVGIVSPYMIAFPERKQAIVDAVKRIKFDPALQNGKPVTVIYGIEYTFSTY